MAADLRGAIPAPPSPLLTTDELAVYRSLSTLPPAQFTDISTPTSMRRASKFVLGMSLLSSCTFVGGDTRLVDGRSIAEIISTDSTIVLLYNPVDCLACDTDMPLWMEYSRMRPDGFRLILARTPHASEQHALNAMQVTPDGVLRSNTWSRTIRNSHQSALILFVDRVNVATQPLRANGYIKQYMRQVLGDSLGTPAPVTISQGGIL